MARISELVKTYKLINDPEAPQWSIRFVGAIVIVAAVLGGAGLLAYTYGAREAAEPAAAATSGSEPADAPPTTVARVLAPGVIPGVPVDASVDAAKALSDWKGAHPEATIVAETPVRDPNGHVIGYDVEYYLTAS